jgi:Nucleotidyl transferase AbiEii toxin, Type IV TA system
VADSQGYADWRSLELAIKEAAKRAAQQAGPGVSAATIDAQIRQARFDRFLCRVFAQGERSEWLLKGGMSMLARVPHSRTTKDMDLAAQEAADLADAERALAALVNVDHGDHLTFRLIRSMPTGLGDNQPGVATRRYIFACIDADHGTQIDTATVDIVVGPPPVGRPEVVEPANRLHLRRPLITHPYRLYPVADQIADKVCATMDTNYAHGKRSSRVKDLIDLVVLAHTQTVDLNELRRAVVAKRVVSNIDPFEHFDMPTDWSRTYSKTAKGVPLAESFTAVTAAELVASFVDPALSNSLNRATWDPQNLTWTTATPSLLRLR